MRVLVVDPRIAGISGDMVLSALVDMVGVWEQLYRLADTIENTLSYCSSFRVEVVDTVRRGVRAKMLKMSIEEDVCNVRAIDLRKYVEEVGVKMRLSSGGISYALNVIDELIEAEARIHGVSRGEVVFHELASSDTVFDIVGVSLMLDALNYFRGEVKVYTTPPALGGGYVKMEHGVINAPAPATLEILRRHSYRFTSTPVDSELTTPTGAALLVNLTGRIVDYYPPLRIERIGYGAGVKDFENIPNVLRIVEGYDFKAISDKIMVLETNIDDVQGEVLGYLAGRIMDLGALDISIIPAVGKKNRPSHIVKVLVEHSKYDEVLKALMNETGTLGVRIYETCRVLALRSEETRTININGKRYSVKVKISRTPEGKLLNIKPDYNDLKAIAEELNIPLRKVMLTINKILLEDLSSYT